MLQPTKWQVAFLQHSKLTDKQACKMLLMVIMFASKRLIAICKNGTCMVAKSYMLLCM